MSDAIKNKLSEQKDVIQNIDDLPKFKNLVNNYRSDLSSVLGSGKSLEVTEEIESEFNSAKNILNLPTGLKKDLKDKRDGLEKQINDNFGPKPTPPATRPRDVLRSSNFIERNNEISKINSILDTTGNLLGNTERMRSDYDKISNDYINKFDLTKKKLPDQKIEISLGGTIITPSSIDLDNTNFFRVISNPDIGELCDENGNTLTKNGNKYTIAIKNKSGEIKNIEIEKTGNILDISATPPKFDLGGIKFIPKLEGDWELNLSIKLGYNVSGTNNLDGISVVHKKPIKINIQDKNKLDFIGRQTEIDTYNTTAPGNIVQNELVTQYNNRLPSLQRETVFEALKHLDGTRFAQLEEYGKKNGKENEIKEELYQQIYRNFLSVGPIALNITNINTYNTFRDWFAHDSHTWNNDPNVIKDNVSYQNYVHNNLNNSVQEYLKYGLNELLTNSVPNNMRLKTELSSFLTDIEQRRNDNEIVGGARINDAIQGNIGANDQMIKHRRRRILGIPFGRPDVSYMRFYNGASHEIKDQSVDISTNSRITDLNNPEPVKYDLKTNISGKNNINVTIDFPENDKRYRRKSITLKQGEVSTLARKILNCPDIPDFKVRAHIVYNMMVSMVQIAKKKNFSLNYRVPGTALQREIMMNDKNISLVETNDTGGTRTENVLFDYDSFVTTNTFHGMGNSRSLQTAIDVLMGHFNFSMNQYHENYRNATRSRLLKTKVSANNFWTSPIKTITNLRTVRQFDFTTNVGNVEISFEKNNITLKKGDIKISGKNLGKLLEYRKNKTRIFDGMEREIVGAFYQALKEKLRENSKINRSNFGVRDPLTQNIYVLDEDGEFGVITPEDPGNILNGRNNRIIRKTELDDVDARGGRRMCTTEETKEIFMNPMIMGRMIKAMNRRM